MVVAAASEVGQAPCPPVEVPGGAVAGTSPMTVWTPVRWWGFPLMTFLFLLVRYTGLTLPTLRKLSFIDYARWSMVRRFPSNGSPQGRDPRRHFHMMFESNFNGTWDQYIDAFAQVIPTNIALFWGNSFNFPGPMPTGKLRDWVARHQYEPSHFYSARPDGTATKVVSALALEKHLRRFARKSKGWDDKKFKKHFDKLLERHEGDL